MCSKDDKIWLFKSTFLEYHKTYLTLTAGKKLQEKKLQVNKRKKERKTCYIPHQRETIFFLFPFKT